MDLSRFTQEEITEVNGMLDAVITRFEVASKASLHDAYKATLSISPSYFSLLFDRAMETGKIEIAVKIKQAMKQDNE